LQPVFQLLRRPGRRQAASADAHVRGRLGTKPSLRRGLAIDPRSQNGHFLLASLLRETRREREALAEFEQARALDPDSPRAQAAAEEIRCLNAKAASALGAG